MGELGNYGYYARPVARRVGWSIRVRRSALLTAAVFSTGLIAGYVWLNPVFVPPGPVRVFDASRMDLTRVFRQLSPILLLLFAALRVPVRLLREPVLWMVVFMFCVVPTLSALAFPSASFILPVVGPMYISGLSLLGICSVPARHLRSWVLGVGCMAFTFFLRGLWSYGFELSDYWGRSRAHFGFLSPTQTAAAVLGASSFVLFAVSAWVRKTGRTKRWVYLTGLAFVFILYMSSSRTTFVGCMVGVAGWIVAGNVRRRSTKLLLAFVIGSYPALIYLVSAFYRDDSPTWKSLNAFSSGRFHAYHTWFVELRKETVLSLLLGPTNYLKRQWIHSYQGFASGESIYFTILFSFGVVGIVSFLAFLGLLAWRLTVRGKATGYGAWCCAVAFCTVADQGITTSNLALFMIFAWAVRSAQLRPPK